MNKKEKVIITGATGFIGSHILEQFIKSCINVACLVRKQSSLSNIDTSQLEIRYGDITDQSSLVAAFRGFDFVIHNAAYVRDWGDYETFYAINVEGTLNVLKACLRHKIRNMIMTGSISSYGEEDCRGIKDESWEYNPHYRYFLERIFPCKLNYYRETKAIATQEASLFARGKNLNLTILEPVWVYGEREFHAGFYHYMKSAKGGMMFAPGSKGNKFHVIYAGDLAQAYLSAYYRKLKGVHRIIIGNRKADFMDKIFLLFCEEAGLKKPIPLPKWMIYPIGFFMELTYSLFKSDKPPLLTRGRVNMFYDNIEYSTKRAEELLDFTNRHTLEEGIKKTVHWYKENELI